LVFILCIVHAGIRRENDPAAAAESMTAAQMLTALRLAHEVERLQSDRALLAGDIGAPLQLSADENVTALATARAAKKD
jgi:hypothetical protein